MNAKECVMTVFFNKKVDEKKISASLKDVT